MKQKTSLLNLTYSAVCLALCLMLPTALGHIAQVGRALCPMHIPVLLCGLLCPWQYAAVVGFLAPLLSSVLLNMPIFFPNAVVMCVELAVYGAASALLRSILPEKAGFLYVALIASMLLGRLAAGLMEVALLCLGAMDGYSLSVFLTSHFVVAVPAFICHIAVIPPIVLALRRAQLAPPRPVLGKRRIAAE